MAELPWQDNTPMDSDYHRLQGMLLQECLRAYYADRTDVFVGADMAVYYSSLEARRNEFRAPDFFVVLDALPREGGRLSWVVWEEERAPSLVVELLSHSTEAIDRGRKMTVYAKAMRVQEYYLFDPLDGRFEAYRLDMHALELRPVPVDEATGVSSSLLDLRLAVVEGNFLGVRNRWLRFVTPSGALLPTGEERAQAEAARADRLAAKLRALGIDPESA